MNRFLIPLITFIAVVLVLAIGLHLNPREVPSPFIGKPAPFFSGLQLHQPQKILTSKDMLGKVWVLNVWASWCSGCRTEHPQIVALAEKTNAPVVGLNYKDNREAALGWLKRWGDPYDLSVMDQNGSIGIDWGVYGVPETFIIDHKGIVHYKNIGPVSANDLSEKIFPTIKRLQEALKT